MMIAFFREIYSIRSCTLFNVLTVIFQGYVMLHIVCCKFTLEPFSGCGEDTYPKMGTKLEMFVLYL